MLKQLSLSLAAFCAFGLPAFAQTIEPITPEPAAAPQSFTGIWSSASCVGMFPDEGDFDEVPQDYFIVSNIGELFIDEDQNAVAAFILDMKPDDSTGWTRITNSLGDTYFLRIEGDGTLSELWSIDDSDTLLNLIDRGVLAPKAAFDPEVWDLTQYQSCDALPFAYAFMVGPVATVFLQAEAALSDCKASGGNCLPDAFELFDVDGDKALSLPELRRFMAFAYFVDPNANISLRDDLDNYIAHRFGIEDPGKKNEPRVTNIILNMIMEYDFNADGKVSLAELTHDDLLLKNSGMTYQELITFIENFE